MSSDSLEDTSDIRKRHWKKVVVLGTVAGVGSLIALRYRVAGPSQYIVRTGLGIQDISVTKKAVVWPFQKYKIMSVEPTTFPIEVDAMSAHRIPFRMPSVWTIGPKNNTIDLKNYARYLMDKGSKGVQETVAGVIQGETRVLTANLELNKLFSDRDEFKNQVVTKINEVIDPFGLIIYNANIAELTDLDDQNRYFHEQKQRALQRVNQEARVAVSEAVREGEIGEKQNRTQTRQEVATLEKDAQIVENERQQNIEESRKNLEVAKAQYRREQQIAEVEARAAAEKRQWELQVEVEQHRQNQEQIKLRATHLTQAQVEAEQQVARAEGEAKAIRLKAEANLFAKQQEATGILALRQAEADGLQRLIESSGGNVDHLNKYLLVRDNILPQLAEKQAEALRGLNPKLMVWNTSGTHNNNSSLSQTMTDLFKTGMPLFDGIKQQTGYDFLKTLNVHNPDTQETTPTSEDDTKEAETR